MQIGNIEDAWGCRTDYTVDGKCSNCGNCCSNLLPITETEKKLIHRYIVKHKIKENKKNFPTSDIAIDMTCPFRNEDKKKCEIYSIRPLICQLYQCNKDINAYDGKLLSEEQRLVTNMREEFYSKGE